MSEKGDQFATSQNLSQQVNQPANFKKELEKTKEEQGFIGNLWDTFKNQTGLGASSKKVEEAIAKFENGELSQEETEKAFEEYKEGQKQCVDIAADIGSGILSFGSLALATGIGIAMTPFTGGASLGLVATGLAVAGVAGATAKVAIKGIDAASGERNYNH